MNKGIINKNNLGAILLLQELGNLKYEGNFYQSFITDNNVILTTDGDINKRIIIPRISCLIAFEHADLVDNSFYENGKIDKYIKCYELESLNAVYTDGAGYYSNNYLIAPFVKNMNK